MEHPEAPSKQNTGAVLVAFHPERGLIDRLRDVSEQVGFALVVDNTPEADRQQWVSEAVSELGLDIVTNGENRGVAAALNQGLEWARERGLKWLLTLDQDSRIYDCMLDTLGLVFEDCEFRDKVAVIGSNYVDRCWQQPYWQGETRGPQDWVDVAFVITSGSIVSLEAAGVAGQFREDFFIDLVDKEFSLRARTKGYRVVLTKKPLMDHGIGEPEWCRLLWKRLTTANHSPMRHYYFTRNHLTMIRDYLPTERAAMLATVKPRLKEIVLVICCERNRLRKLGAMALGAWDALRGRMDRMI